MVWTDLATSTPKNLSKTDNSYPKTTTLMCFGYLLSVFDNFLGVDVAKLVQTMS